MFRATDPAMQKVIKQLLSLNPIERLCDSIENPMFLADYSSLWLSLKSKDELKLFLKDQMEKKKQKEESHRGGGRPKEKKKNQKKEW